MNFDDALAAQKDLVGVSLVTELRESRWLSEATGGDVRLKCENLQRTGSFKIRGAYTRMARLTDAERAAGVVAASAGNHAQGVALAAQLLGIDATIYMPEGAALPKVQATLGYGARVELAGLDVSGALLAAQERAHATNATFIHPYDHEDIVAGQATVGLEIIEQFAHVDTIVVPMGGGGLAAGICLLKERYPNVEIVGVQAEAAAAWPLALAHGAPRHADLGLTMADGIAVADPGNVPFDVIRDRIDRVITVTEESMSRGLIGLLERSKLLVEPSGATSVAALLQHPEEFGGNVVPILSGGNIDALLLLEVIRHGLASAGRFMMFRVRITDRPGELMRLLTELAVKDVNILNVNHDRGSEKLGIGEVEVAMQVATRGPEHRESVRAHLLSLGYELY